MKGILHLVLSCILATVALVLPRDAVASTAWQAPFDTSTAAPAATDSALSLTDALALAAAKNPTLKSLNFERLAANARLEQVGLWSNPEIGVELGDVGWDAPGLKESEITLSVSQELELFGRRGARKNLARTEIDATEFQVRVAAFDLYLEVKHRLYALAHARQFRHLSEVSVKLADDIVQNISVRIDKGAALQSELLLARLEKQRTQLMLEQAQQEMTAAEAALVALWDGQTDGVRVAALAEPELVQLTRLVSVLDSSIDSSRAVMQLHRQSAIIQAERALAAADARPNITLNGGFKRLETDNSKSFLFGLSLPMPLFNRNQGTREGLRAQLHSLNYQIDRQRLEVAAKVKGQSMRLLQLVRRHDILDSLLMPTAEEAYQTLRRAYEAGRLPFTQLLEAARSLNELRFDHNDMLLAIHEQIIALESQTGVAIRTDKEN